MITDIYIIKTRNSTYQIQVNDQGNSRARRETHGVSSQWKQVASDNPRYLQELAIGPGFLIPGAWDTSNVLDYVHMVRSREPKKHVAPGLNDMIDQIVAPLRPRRMIQVNPPKAIVKPKNLDPKFSD